VSCRGDVWLQGPIGLGRIEEMCGRSVFVAAPNSRAAAMAHIDREIVELRDRRYAIDQCEAFCNNPHRILPRT
jgi:hypothetical protein